MAAAIGVGIVGASAAGGWAARAHVPALRSLPELRLAAVCASSPASAARSAEAFGVPATADAAELVERSDVELVVVSVKVPFHGELVELALAAGKPVFCEWPLGNGSAEAAAMAAAAVRRGVPALVGLQARAAPAVERMRELVAGGYVGRLLSASMSTGVPSMGRERIPARAAYTADVRNGANVLTIPAGHALDTLCFCLGELADVSAVVATRTPRAVVEETGEALAVTAPDHVALDGTLEGGAVVSALVHGGAPGPATFELTATGTEGVLRLTARPTAGATGLQMATLTLAGRRGEGAAEPLTPPEPDGALAGPPANVRTLYARLAAALRDGAPFEPGFATAVRRHAMLDAIVAASAGGRRVPAG